MQGHLNHERERVRQLKQRLTDLEAAYHATLDSLDRLQGPSWREQIVMTAWLLSLFCRVGPISLAAYQVLQGVSSSMQAAQMLALLLGI